MVLSDFFSDSDLEENDGLSYFANALLPGDGEASISVAGTLTFEVGLEYILQMGKVNPYILGTTGFDLDLSAAGEVDYEASVGAFQGYVEAEFAVGP